MKFSKKKKQNIEIEPEHCMNIIKAYWKMLIHDSLTLNFN